MELLMKQISRHKNDVVYVGSWVARKHNKLRRQPHDIDIVVNSLDGLETFGEIKCFESKSVMSNGSKRCQIVSNEVKIDIWVRDELPKWELIDGMKFQTLESQIQHYKNILDLTDNMVMKKSVNERLRILQ